MFYYLFLSRSYIYYFIFYTFKSVLLKITEQNYSTVPRVFNLLLLLFIYENNIKIFFIRTVSFKI